MLKKDQIETVAWSEMLRFSVAISVQLERVAYWREQLRQARKDWNDASYRAIFESSVPPNEFEAHLRRLKSEFELPPKMHLKSEIQFLLIAVRGVYGMAVALRQAVASNDGKVRCVQGALSAFEKHAPDVVHLRNLHEHMDQLIQGKGDAYAKLPDPNLGSIMALSDDDVTYLIGGKDWSIRELARAAKDLVRDVGGCVQQTRTPATSDNP